MKKLLLVAAATLVGLSVQAQGLLNMNTFGGGANARAFVVNVLEGSQVTLPNGTVIANATSFLPGTNAIPGMFNLPASARVYAAVYVGPEGSTANQLVQAGAAGWIGGTTVSQHGYVLGSTGGGLRGATNSLGNPIVAGGSKAVAQIRAWVANSGTVYNSYEEFMAAAGAAPGFGYAGTSDTITTAANLGVPPTGIAATLTGMNAFVLYPVPEPSVIGLGLLGLAGLIFIRRRK